MNGLLIIDGSHGEGGGQILRTALSLAAILGRPIRIDNIRAARRQPGLAAQHLTCIRAAGAICGARIEGDSLGSGTLRFTPGTTARPGAYAFDVARARAGGSAGSASLVLQTIMLPLALADGASTLRVKGGTHLLWSPSYHYLRDVWLPLMRRLGVDADLELEAWGWYPVGKGAIRATVQGGGFGKLKALELTERGMLTGITGCAVAANLPGHIPRRMAERATQVLAGVGVPVSIEPLSVSAACAGAGIFLTARYEEIGCGFAALGTRGKAAELVAEEAVEELLAHNRGPGAMDIHLGDQILPALAIVQGTSCYTVPRISSHLATNAWLVERFGLARILLESDAERGGQVTVVPQHAAP